jgi:hypothetical protein
VGTIRKIYFRWSMIRVSKGIQKMKLFASKLEKELQLIETIKSSFDHLMAIQVC